MKRIRPSTRTSHNCSDSNDEDISDEDHHDYEGDNDEDQQSSVSKKLKSSFRKNKTIRSETSTTNHQPSIESNSCHTSLKQCYQQALIHFNEECLNTVPHTRSEPYHTLLENIHSCIHRSKGMAMYVFGKSGTGKSFTIKKLIHDIQQDSQQMKHLFATIPIIDCLSEEIDSLQKLCKILHDHFTKRDSRNGSKAHLFTKSKKLRLIILDSADHLLKHKKVKEQIQKWTQHSSCIFIGITSTQIASHEHLIIFTPVPTEELSFILQEKLKFLLQRTSPPMMDKNLISIISKHFDEFDLRHVFKLIQMVITKCMEHSRPQVDMATFFQLASKEMSNTNPVTIISYLTLPQQRLLEILTRKEGIIRNVQDQLHGAQRKIALHDATHTRNRELSQPLSAIPWSSSSESEEVVMNYQDISSLVYHETVSLDHVIRLYQDYMKDFTNETMTYHEVKEMCRVLDDLKLVKLQSMKIEAMKDPWFQCGGGFSHPSSGNMTTNDNTIIPTIRASDATNTSNTATMSIASSNEGIASHILIDTITVLVSYEVVQEGIAKRKERTTTTTH
ncbi:hypothetical protein C9374_001268 [Naegleria lovaniensis]|uniref:ORC1/DEAH AAA+ ATPase domain-containing protein n=1 Tax=Naegleria lovaniensis TaxID=51637 RepID=A0AA88GX21_NAELO|nr:uncharacterized protein C9374_001268 [Naegleria lovaniensis]KAG2387674.1 hypothetical protein C9374_001268 [Naegleria lovaniensis]